MDIIAKNIIELKKSVPSGVEIVAVSKFHPAEMILDAYNAGQRIFGESRVQEFIEKEKVLPKDISWHFIGHLQTNKVKQIIGKTSLIESVDSLRLLNLIEKESENANVLTEVLLQVHVAKEETKFGFLPSELMEFFEKNEFQNLKAVRILGLMGMATNTDSVIQIKEDFKVLHSLYEKIKSTYFKNDDSFCKLSMGMSGDWQIAVREGSNMIRIGSAIFGER